MKNFFLSVALAWSVLASANDLGISKSDTTFPNQTAINTANCSKLKIAIVFDNYASETSWDLKNEAGDIIESGGGYTNSETDISKDICLDDGIYTFTINDSYTDGICCTYGQGSYAITLNGTALVAGASFGASESKSFSIGETIPPPNPDNGEVSQEILDLLELVNTARANDGKNPLKLNTKLTSAALAHANDMNDNNFFSHTGSNGSSVSNRVDLQGYSWNAIAENIANGQRTVEEVHNTWMNSPPHRGNLLNASYSEIGLSRVANLWVQVFGNSFNSFQFKEIDITKSDLNEQQLEMYPNVLNKSQNTITLSGHERNTIYSIYTITGKRVQKGIVTDIQIELQNVKSGMYLIHFISGQKNSTKRFIKK